MLADNVVKFRWSKQHYFGEGMMVIDCWDQRQMGLLLKGERDVS